MRNQWNVVVALLMAGVLTAGALAQEHRLPPNTPLPPGAQQITADDLAAARVPDAIDNDLPTILVTGYWPPTNEMLRPFSRNAAQNPDGWVGENWEQRGYNVVAYFPEFPDGVLNQGVGDFEVDYQDTSEDFWRVTGEIRPIAIITTGLTGPHNYFEVELYHKNHATWTPDYVNPTQPTPTPPDGDNPAGHRRSSTLPFRDIVLSINAADLTVQAYADANLAGDFLCEFIGYHATWYHDTHSDPDDPNRCVAAGHIHVGGEVTVEEAQAATEITLRRLIAMLNTEVSRPGDLNCDGVVDSHDIDPFVAVLLDVEDYDATFPDCDAQRADVNGDGVCDVFDINPFVALLPSE